MLDSTIVMVWLTKVKMRKRKMMLRTKKNRKMMREMWK